MNDSEKTSHAFSILLFDLGNVLVNVDYPAFLRTLRYDHTMNERELYTLLEEDSRSYELGKASPEEYLRIVNAKLGTSYTFEEFREAWNAILPEPTLGMTELIESLVPNNRLMILSNTNALHCEHMLQLSPVLRYFERYFLSFEIGAVKPDPAIYAYVLKNVDVPPDRILFIDDLEQNIKGAVNAGMRGIVFEGVEPLRFQLKDLKIF